VKKNFSTVTFPIFTQEQVKKINKEIVNQNIVKESETDRAQNAIKTGDFYHVPCMPLMELLHPWLVQCQQINKAVFGYDIYWDFHLDSLNYNVYGIGGEYEWHIDGTKPPNRSDMKLTCLLNLSKEPYQGGEFCMINSAKKIEFTSGMGLIMNSLIAHKVTPVTKGERITLTYWADGPSWK